ncbi:hypothetical protein Dimus_022112, partial [Dionaea muscipula]
PTIVERRLVKHDAAHSSAQQQRPTWKLAVAIMSIHHQRLEEAHAQHAQQEEVQQPAQLMRRSALKPAVQCKPSMKLPIQLQPIEACSPAQSSSKYYSFQQPTYAAATRRSN